MTDFLKDIALTVSVKAERILFRLPVMRKKLRAVPLNVNSSQKFSCRLRAMPHSAESIYKTVLAHESGDPGVQLNEKNRGPKIS
jgi:hypothetical protein